MKRTLLILANMLASTYVIAADGPCVVPGRGHFQIHVGAGGLFGAFAHNHLIEAEKINGCATIDPKDITHSSIKLDFPTNSIRVIDPKENAKDCADVQKTNPTAIPCDNSSRLDGRVQRQWCEVFQRAGTAARIRNDHQLCVRRRTGGYKNRLGIAPSNVGSNSS